MEYRTIFIFTFGLIQISSVVSTECFTCSLDYQQCNQNVDECVYKCYYEYMHEYECEYSCNHTCEYCAQDLSTCLVCAAGSYGYTCQDKCINTCLNGRCDRSSGMCEKYYYGDSTDWSHVGGDEADTVNRFFQWVVAAIASVIAIGFFAMCILYKVWNLREAALLKFPRQRAGYAFDNMNRRTAQTSTMQF